MSELYPEDSDGSICELSVEELKQQKVELYKLISKYEQKIRQAKQDINDCETAIFIKCKHKWIYDQCANFDDHIKHICEKCNLYKSHTYYNLEYKKEYYE